ncbi:hypothetical protein HC256_001775 [Beauveria bassiana]|nr:hypothetical protein HC256_001775 [Beauveria bassiana]
MKIAFFLLAAALGSASPVRTQNSIQARDGKNALSEQKSCDCSKPFDAGNSFCPDGYEIRGVIWPSSCLQIGCSDEDYEAKCKAKPQDAKPTAVVEQPTNTPIALSEQKSCDCSKPFDAGNSFCPDGYEIREVVWPSSCLQIGCSDEDYEAKCKAKPQDAKPTAVVEQPTNTPIALSEQKSCDCSKPFDAGNSFCPDGYETRGVVWPSSCLQIGCSDEDYEAKCKAKPQDTKPTTSVCI